MKQQCDGYVQCAKLLQYPDRASRVLGPVVEKVKDLEIDIVVGPAIFTERDNGEMTLKRGFHIEKGQRVLIAEDVVTRGKSALEAIKVVEKLGGQVVAIACIADRTKGNLIYPLFAAIRLDIKIYDADDCPLCEEGLDFVKQGSRKF